MTEDSTFYSLDSPEARAVLGDDTFQLGEFRLMRGLLESSRDLDAQRRDLEQAAREFGGTSPEARRLRQALQSVDGPTEQVEMVLEYRRLMARQRALEMFQAEQAAATTEAAAGASDRLAPGGSFLLDLPPDTPAVWGDGDQVLWAEGESLVLAGTPGVGKTTLAGQVVAARLDGGTVLGLTVRPTSSRVLYLAMDRPQQIARALARTLGSFSREVLDERLVFWPGPPLADMAAQPETLLALARQAAADTVVVDSVKDAALGLSSDEVGAGYNRARQMCIAAGVEVLELHHTIKKNANGGAPKALADLYGSTWITAGAGSVVLLEGTAGDPVVGMHHLKQPAETVGPYRLLHDHTAGLTTVYHETDLVALALAAGTDGLTAKSAAANVEDTAKPTDAQTQRARRRLDKLVTAGRLTFREGSKGGSRGGQPAVWLHPSHDAEGDYGGDYAP
ncbi:hypothetical protein GCM10011366_12840 [Ornithinimicrobium tianjinense]|uniref:AAA domain-containing protein n=1 Tax=Ornithinimicrobium tianjinense TaxID=1195761 RepID=A0A917BJN3_9MICO|nr:hypothetical protein GCM10011366_12840 [Ornithinimicrobium tianjinense]